MLLFKQCKAVQKLVFLAVQDNSIGDIVTHSLSHSLSEWRFDDYNDYNDYHDYNDYNDYNYFNDYIDYNHFNNDDDYNDYQDSDLDFN